MKITLQYELLKRLHAFLQRKATGMAKDFAKRLEIARATLFRYFDYLRELGAEIKYNRVKQTYYYANDFLLKF